MAELLFHLRSVSDEEANAVRDLLIDGKIDIYETSAGTWGLGVAAIWLRDATQSKIAHALLDDYQQQRQAMPQLPVISHWQYWIKNPVRFLCFSFLIAFMLTVTLWPFFFF